MNLYTSGGKRLFDLMLGTIALIVLSPVMLLVALLVRSRIGRPVIFRQQRPGYKGEPFTIFKFRTMTNERNQKGNLLPDADRLLPLGETLRRTSLDELPEIFNVLRGDMSLVGPRPLMMAYLDRYTDQQMRRHDVKPGITGWAQINGRNAISWEEKFKLDLWYVDNVSLWLDVKIIVHTLLTIIRREGINAEGHPTMPEFMGTLAHQNEKKEQ